jgi:hypothetical protein
MSRVLPGSDENHGSIPPPDTKKAQIFGLFLFYSYLFQVEGLWVVLNLLIMDPDSRNNSEKQYQNSNYMLNVKHVLPPSRIRCSIFINNEIDGFLLDYGCNFLPYFSIFSWLLFLLF